MREDTRVFLNRIRDLGLNESNNFINMINALGNRIYEEYEDKMDNPEDRQVLRVLAGGFSVWSNTLYALSRMEEEEEE